MHNPPHPDTPVFDMQEAASGDARWEFIRKWCDQVRGNISVEAEYAWRSPLLRTFRVKLGPWWPSKTLELTRDALLLLAMVAHVSMDALAHVLSSYCGVRDSSLASGEFEGVRFMIMGPNGYQFERGVSFTSGFSEFFALFRGPYSAGVIEAARQIAAMDPDKMTIPVEVRIRASIYEPHAMSDDNMYRYIRDAWNSIVALKAGGNDFRLLFSLPLGLADDGVDGDVSPSDVFGVLVLDQVEVDEPSCRVSNWLSLLVDEMLMTTGGMTFSLISLNPALRREQGDSEVDVVRKPGAMMERLLCGPTCTRVEHLSFYCGDLECLAFDRLCSAIAETQTSTTLSLSRCGDGVTARRQMWANLAYATFSKHAHSTITELDLEDVSLGEEEVQAIESVLRSTNPTDYVFGRRQGGVEALDSPIKTAGSEHQLLYALNKFAPVTPYKFRLSDGDVLAAGGWRTQSTINRVKILNDDGVSGDVDVLIPGYGVCKSRRDYLTPMQHPHPLPTAVVTVLAMGMDDHPDSWVGLPRFLELVGSSLMHLSIESEWGDAHDVQIDEILQWCPNLKTLFIPQPRVETELFLKAYRAGRTPYLSDLDCNFTDIGMLARELADSRSLLAQNITRWRYTHSYDRTAPVPDAHLRDIVEMLSVNRRLEVVEVNGVWAADNELNARFRAYDNETIPVARERLPLDSCLAFLSILSVYANQSNREHIKDRTGQAGWLDHHVISNILAFAATCVRRRVFDY